MFVLSHYEAHLFVQLVLILMVLSSHPCLAGRYRRCQEGCCIHEYCAYNLICYPRIHCHFGCPDGYCAGSGQTPDGIDRDNKREFIKSGKTTPTSKGSSHLRDIMPSSITENYSHSDRSRGSISVEIGKRAERERTVIHLNQQKGNSQRESPDGICMPLPPCKKSNYCGMSHKCSFNFNLGYNVCQYNLEIGTTLCYDTHGNFMPKPQN